MAKTLELLGSEVHGKDVTAEVDIEASSSRFGPQSAESRLQQALAGTGAARKLIHACQRWRWRWGSEPHRWRRRRSRRLSRLSDLSSHTKESDGPHDTVGRGGGLQQEVWWGSGLQNLSKFGPARMLQYRAQETVQKKVPGEVRWRSRPRPEKHISCLVSFGCLTGGMQVNFTGAVVAAACC